MLLLAANDAHYAIHLGIVHLKEGGSAEPHYDSYSYRRGGYDDYDDDDLSGSYDVVDIFETEKYIDGWINREDLPVDFGKIPFEDEELLPYGILEDDEPDEDRLIPPTGNDGVSFERTYCRAALVIWRVSQQIEVLLQRGIEPALAYLKKQIESSFQDASTLASTIIMRWETMPNRRNYSGKNPLLSEMLKLLMRLNNPSLIERFIANIVIHDYDCDDNTILAKAICLLSADKIADLSCALVKANLQPYPTAIINFIKLLLSEDRIKKESFFTIAQEIVSALKLIDKKEATSAYFRFRKAVDAEFVHALWNIFQALQAENLLGEAVQAMIVQEVAFKPQKVLLPALACLHKQTNGSIKAHSQFIQLWHYVSEFLLTSSGPTPQEPKDFRQDVTISCTCELCKELQTFVRDPKSNCHSFRTREDNRKHIQETIGRHNMDMAYITENTGSPKTLVCTKTRKKYESQLAHYKAAIASIKELLPLVNENEPQVHSVYKRLLSAVEVI